MRWRMITYAMVSSLPLLARRLLAFAGGMLYSVCSARTNAV